MEWLRKIIKAILAWFGVKEVPPPERPADGTPQIEAGDAEGNGRVTVDPDAGDDPPKKPRDGGVWGRDEDTVEWTSTTGEEGGTMARPELCKGDKGDEVKDAQRLLNLNGCGLKVDGDFGGGTEGAVESFQQSYGLPPTGKIDADTWELLDRPAFAHMPELADLDMKPAGAVQSGNSAIDKSWADFGGLLSKLAEMLGFNPSAAVAVLVTESSGSGFGSDGRLKIRFENHIFYSRWGKRHPDTFAAHFKYDPNKRWTKHYWRDDPNGEWRRLHTTSAGQNEEWLALTFARTLDDEAALQSISMGSPQVMGFNSAKVGYDTARAMFDSWSEGDRQQILGLFDFIRSNHKMVRALRVDGWSKFAYYYNGSGQAEKYGERIGGYVTQAQAAGIA